MCFALGIDGLETDITCLCLIQILARPIGLGAIFIEQRGIIAKTAHICCCFQVQNHLCVVAVDLCTGDVACLEGDRIIGQILDLEFDSQQRKLFPIRPRLVLIAQGIHEFTYTVCRMALLVTVLLEERADRIIDRIAAAQCTRCTHSQRQRAGDLQERTPSHHFHCFFLLLICAQAGTRQMIPMPRIPIFLRSVKRLFSVKSRPPPQGAEAGGTV